MGLKREILGHSAVYSVAGALGKLASFLMLPFYAHIFEAEGYGIIALIDASVGVLAIAFAAGSSTAILRIYHEESGPRKSLVIGTGIWMGWSLSLLCIPLPILASPWISAFLLGNAAHWPLITLALITFVISMGGESASTFLVIRQQSVLYSLVNLLQLVLGLTLNIILVLYLRIGLIGIFISSLVCASVGSVIFHWAAIREHGLRYDADIGRKLREFWFPLIPGELFAYAARQTERVLVRFMISLEAVGILEMAYKFSPFLLNLFIVDPFRRAWGTKSMEIGLRAEAPKEISSMFTLYMFLTFFVAVFLASNIGTVLVILTPPEFWPAARIVRIDVASTVVAAAREYLVFGLLFTKQTKTITQIRIVTSIVKIGLSVVFIAAAGLVGAAYSALVMIVVNFIWTFSKAQHAYRLSLEYRKITVLGVSAIALMALVDHLPQFAGWVLDQLEALLSDNLIAYLANTPLGGWRSGKLIEILDERTADFAKLLVSCCLCLLYGAFILVVKPDLIRFNDIRFLRSAIQALHRPKAE